MLAALIFLAIVGMGSTKPNAILKSSSRYEGLMEEMRFWGSTICQAGRRRTFSLHESPPTSSARHLRDFFGALVTSVQTECVSTMSTKFHLIEDETNDTKTFFSFYADESPTGSPEILQDSEDVCTTGSGREINLFPCKDVEVVLLTVENSVRALMNGSIFNDLDNGHQVLVLIISEARDPLESAESLKNTFVVLLQRLWQERGVLNVFFAAPFSSLGCRIWFYNPFLKSATSTDRGKIFALEVESIPGVDRVKNLNGYTLNIGMFEVPPAAIKLDSALAHNFFPFTQKSQAFGGIDGITMTVVAEQMNFALNIVPPTDGVEFGYVCVNGTFVGTIGDAAYHRIDIGFNSMYTKLYTPPGLEAIELTVPIDFDRLCIIVPRAKKIPRWLRTFYYFDSAIWGCILLTQILISFVWYLLRNFRGSPREKVGLRASYHTLLLDTFLLFVGAPLKLNVSQAERMLLSALLLLGLTVVGMFTGTLYHSFTKEMHYKEINTLKEIDASGIEVGTASPNLRDVFGVKEIEDEAEDDAEEVRSLRQKLQVLDYDGVPTIQKTAYRRNIAALSREHSFRVLMYRYIDDTGTTLLHKVEECPRSYYLSYVVPKDSVYIDRLNLLIRRLQEAGLPSLWDSVTTNKLVVEESAKVNLKRVNVMHSSFNVHDMQTSFFILLIGHLVAVFVLIGEIIYDGKKQKTLKCRRRIRGKAFENKCLANCLCI